ncbi:Protein of unknown function [Sphingomonas guangdongensis]|uniref:Lysozyme inhibitor LprI-like N-terminal domain-containing protein n=1 Tax=Sphingomonas guangdongensis TaxID=1141890 RepID=A0A285QG86_9SPHN|nr:lysozyme inhibitor LprI family protein [Sphingomonas guangdongensis]SOB80831.1 Protein of unknown function [Sphingomonas guangdongensis]
MTLGLWSTFAIAIAPVSSPSPLEPQDTRPFELADANDRLNSDYQRVLARLRDEDRQTLRAAQRVWLTFRDADCKLAIADVRDCLIQRTDERQAQLRSTSYTDRAGRVFSLDTE